MHIRSKHFPINNCICFDAAVVNPNGIKMFLVNCLITFPIKRNSEFSDGHKSVPKNFPDSPIYTIELLIVLF